jgi:hypothetical protein
MRDPLLAIEVHEVARAFRLRTRLKDLEPEVVPGDGDTWHVRLASRQDGMEVHEALTRVREWLVEEELSAAIVRMAALARLSLPTRRASSGNPFPTAAPRLLDRLSLAYYLIRQ